MDDFKLNGSNMDINEIDRIQQEIDKDLASLTTVVNVEADGAVDAEQPPTPALVVEAEDKPMTARDSFYTETIKHEAVKHKKDRFKRVVAIVCIVSILGGGFLGIGLSIGTYYARLVLFPGIMGANNGETSEAAENEEIAFAFKETSTSMQISGDKADYYESSSILVDIVNKVEPSVCGINVVVEGTQNFFNMPYGMGGSGSGIVFSENDGKVYIVTNHHVINGASRVSVSISGCEPVSAKLVGSEPQSDLAVIYVEKEELKKLGVNKIVIAEFGDSDQMQVGETVLAIGNALGEGNTATVGIVSAKDKEITVEDKTLSIIQTDAAINPGNSGGPLVNTRGEVIGINTAKLSQSSIEGMGYSITANVAKPIITDIMSQRTKPFLGIRGQTVTEEMAEIYNLPMIGVYVSTVVEGSSAEKAGMQRSDIITGFGDETIFTWEQLTEIIKNYKVGDEVEIRLLREGKTLITIKAVLTENNINNF